VLNSGGGTYNYGTFSTGSSSGDYRLFYQNGVHSVGTSFDVGAAYQSRGSFIIKGGSLSASGSGAGIIAGDSGFGEIANSGGTVTDSGNLTVDNVGFNNYSFYSQNSGSTTVSGHTTVGTSGLLDISGGSYSTNGITASSGSTLELGGSLTGASTATVSAGPVTLGSGSTLKFDFADTGAPTLNLGSNSLNLVSGSELVIDLSNYHYTGSDTKTFTLFSFGSLSGESVSTFAQSTVFVGNNFYNVGTIYTGTAYQITITHTLSQNEVTSTGALSSETGYSYQYSPSIMYDETEGLYKMWYTGDPNGGTGDQIGDNIMYKEYPTFAGLANAPATYAFSKDGNPNTVNGWDVADPDVYRDQTTGTYYLAYSGNTGYPSQSQPNNTQIGMAQSADDGRTFSAYYLNYPAAYPNGELVSPTSTTNTYGVGQPGVAYVNGYWFMFFSDINSDGYEYIDCLRSPNAGFTSGVTFMGQWKIPTLSQPSSTGLSPGDGVAFDPTTGQMLLFAEATGNPAAPGGTPGGDFIGVNHFYWDSATDGWTYGYFNTISAMNQPFSFAEGIGVLTNSQGSLLQSADNYYVFAASTWVPNDKDQSGAIEGGIYYMTVVDNT
jgi:hypothetical protein